MFLRRYNPSVLVVLIYEFDYNMILHDILSCGGFYYFTCDDFHIESSLRVVLGKYQCD